MLNLIAAWNRVRHAFSAARKKQNPCEPEAPGVFSGRGEGI